jgi:Zn-dependent protease/CBS domain-containing protein
MGGLTLGRPFGIPVVVHPTWLIAFAVVAWALAAGYLPADYPGWAAWEYWLAGAVAAVLLFGSVLLHELSHAAVARARGLRVERITLFVFGGMAGIAEEPRRPVDDFLVAAVGPLVSLLAAGVARLLLPLAAAVGPGPAAVVGYLALANLLLALFNLLPGLPLDGGRVLRAALWRATGSFARATRLASVVGQALGYLLVALGFLSVLGGDLVGGLWMSTIGWFLGGAAEASRQPAGAHQAFGVTVDGLASHDVPAVAPDLSLEAFVYELVVGAGRRAVPVVEGDRLVGIVSVTDAGKVAPAAWCGTTVGDVMTRADLATVRADADASVALELMARRGVHQLPVVDRGGRLVGLITRADVVAWLARGQATRLGLDAGELRGEDARARPAA